MTFALQSGAGRGGASSPGRAGSRGAVPNEAPILASGVAPVTASHVDAMVTPATGKVGKQVGMTQVATAPIDASGNFVLRPDPTSRALAPAVVDAIANNNSWVNLQLFEFGADGKTAVTNIARQYVDASGRAFSLAEFRAAPASGHWVGDGGGGTKVNPKYEVPLRFPKMKPLKKGR